MSTTNYQKMTDGQKLANWMTELGTCVYNRLKKEKITMGLLHNNDNIDLLQDEVTIDQAEKYLDKNIKKTTGFQFIFNFDQDEIKHIFDGEVEIRYEEDDNEHFVPTVYLGMKPQVAKKEKSVTSKPTKEDKYYDDLVAITFEPYCEGDYCPQLVVEQKGDFYHIYNREKGRKEDFSWTGVNSKTDLKKHMIKWYNEKIQRTKDDDKLQLVRWDTALDENVGLTFAKPIFDGKTENEIDEIVQEKWENDDDFREDYEKSTLYFNNGHSVLITDEGKTKWRITKDYERKKKNWPNFDKVVRLWEEAVDSGKLDDDHYLNLDTLKITSKSTHFVDKEFRVYSIDKDLLDEIVMVLG